MTGRSKLFFLGCMLAWASAGAAAQTDGRMVARLLEDADNLLNELEARRSVAPDDPALSRVKTIAQEVSALAPANPYLTFLRARYMVLTGFGGDASLKLLEFVDTPQGQTEWRAYRLLGDSFLQEFPRLAKSNYKKAAALNPGDAGVLFGLSVCELKLGAIAGAVRLARETVRADGRVTIRYIAHLARVLQAQERWDEALHEAENAMGMARSETERDQVSRRPWESLSSQYSLVMSILRARIAARGKNFANDFVRLDTCLRQQLRVREKLVLHDFLRLVESGVRSSEPGTPLKLLLLYGRLLSEVGRTKDAIRAFQHAAKLDPNNEKAQDALKRLRKIAASPP